MPMGVEPFGVTRALALGVAFGALLLAQACESNSTSIDDPSAGGTGASSSQSGTSGSSTSGGTSGAADAGGTASGATDAGGAPGGEPGGASSGGPAGGALPVAGDGGGGMPAGEGGGSGTEAECEIADDCAVLNDCCTCAALPAKNLPGECEKLCIQSACAARGLESVTAVCSDKRCVFDLSCDSSLVTCKLAKPSCDAGMIPSVIEPCWGPCIAPDECRDLP
jgi:hypothetical protein